MNFEVAAPLACMWYAGARQSKDRSHQVKSLTKSIRSKLVSQGVHAQLSLPVGDVLRDVRSAFCGLCINAGKCHPVS
jgi:hypothetical protein